MTTTAVQDQALLAAPKVNSAPPSSDLVKVARKYRVSPLKQLKDSFLLHRGPGKLTMNEYFQSGLYHPDISWQDKKQYVGMKANYTLNKDLSAGGADGNRVFLSDKLMYTSLIEQLGFRTTETQAVFSTMRRAGKIPALASKDALRAFLINDAVFPLFGKPQSYSGSFGSALLERIEGQTLHLGDGRKVDLEAFCAEIEREYGEGYLFQTALKQHPDLTAAVGNAIGTVRIVTVRDTVAPRILYALWKIPSPTAMSDNFWQDGSMIAQVDHASGHVGRCRAGTGLLAQDVEDHPVSGARIDALQIPQWEEACDMATEAHALFPEFGIVGWDMAITDAGPAIVECNDNPFHVLYQQAYVRGIRNADFVPVFDAVTSHSRAMLDERVRRSEERLDSRKG